MTATLRPLLSLVSLLTLGLGFALGCGSADETLFAPADTGRTTDSGGRALLDTTGPGDGADATPDIGADAAASVCGDGVVQDGEACDDGNAVDDDACADDCTINAVAFCQPCVDDIQCGVAADLCVFINDGSYCAQSCTADTDCSRGLECEPVIEDGTLRGDLCVPQSGACDVCLDDDEDGVCNEDDACIGEDDTVDTDEDGVPDCEDPCPGDASNTDTDGDTICDGDDVCPTGDDRADIDEDGVPNACDPCPSDSPDDSDDDGVCDIDDICEGSDDAIDLDEDGTPDGCDDSVENCTDGRDNDDDGIIDCEDTDCARHSECGPCEAPTVIDGFVSVEGTTEEPPEDEEGLDSPLCGISGAAEAVFQFTADEAGTVCASTAGTEFDTVLYVRTTCNDPEAELECNDDGDSGTTSELQWSAEAGVAYFVVVDGFSSSNFGDFTLTMIEGTCSGASEGPACESIETADGFGTYTGITGGLSGAGGGCTIADGPEAVWSFTASATGTVCADTNGTEFDTVLHVRSTCADPGTEIDCDDDGGDGVQSQVEFEATSGDTYFLFVDGFSERHSGNYTLNIANGPC